MPTQHSSHAAGCQATAMKLVHTISCNIVFIFKLFSAIHTLIQHFQQVHAKAGSKMLPVIIPCDMQHAVCPGYHRTSIALLQLAEGLLCL